MATYNKTIGVSGQETGGGIKSLNLTMASDEYPTSISWGSVAVYVPVSAGAALGFSLCNTSGGNSITLMSSTYYPQGTGVINSGSTTVSGSALKGKALAINVEFLNSAIFNNTWSFSLTTTYATYSVYISNSTGGTVTASSTTGVRAGATITLTRSASTGYQFSAWNPTPSTLSINSSNQFTMPASNVTIAPTWSKINYTITKNISPAGAGTITAPSTATYGSTVSVSQSPASGYTFSSWSLSSGTVSNNQFTMPASNVTLTANYVTSQHTLVWSSASLTINVSSGSKLIRAVMTGTATDSYGETVEYWLQRDGALVAQFVNNEAILILDEEDSGVSITFQLVAVTSIEAVGDSDTIIATFPTTPASHSGYYDGSMFQKCIPYYYNGTSWIECEWQYWDGTNWNISEST